MENASKALIIAGSILVTVIVISLGVMVFRNMSRPVQEEANLDAQSKSAFNSKIIPYIGKNVSGSQVNALIQLARTIDQKAITDGDTIRRVTITGDGNVTISGNNVNYKNVETGFFYTVDGTYDNGLLTSITITKN